MLDLPFVSMRPRLDSSAAQRPAAMIRERASSATGDSPLMKIYPLPFPTASTRYMIPSALAESHMLAASRDARQFQTAASSKCV